MKTTARTHIEASPAAPAARSVAPGRKSAALATYAPIVQRKASDPLADDSIDQRSELLETRATVDAAPAEPGGGNGAHLDAALRGTDLLADASIDQRGELIETRATVSGGESAGPLSGRRLRSACRTNPHYAKGLGWTADLFGASGDARSEQCAQGIARFQTEAGLMVDGIAGPNTTARARANGQPRTPELGEELMAGPRDLDAAYLDLE